MSYTERNNRAELYGKIFSSDSKSFVVVGGVKYQITPKTAFQFKYCTNLKEYVESVEYFAYRVLIKKDIPNEGWFEIEV